MRITSEAKTETRERILEAARRLFRKDGFEATSTRLLATEARIATGTLFNYFSTKEAVAVAIAAEAFSIAEAEFDQRSGESESLEETLFSYIITGLRHLGPDRAYMAGVLHGVWSGFSSTSSIAEAAQLREHHLERVGRMIFEATAPDGAFDFHIQLHLYWTLYLGVLAFWARDESPKQEGTLAMLDHVVRMYVQSLRVKPIASKDAIEAQGTEAI